MIQYYLYTALVIVLIIVHGRFDNFFKIDSLTLLLVALLILLPYIPLIKTWKFKYGDFETEVTTEEVNEIARKSKEIPQREDMIENENFIDLKALAETDPQLALAKIRIEIEKQLRLLYNIYLPADASRVKNPSPRMIVERLLREDIIEKPLASIINDLIVVANRTIHGEEISPENALKLLDTYDTASGELEYVIINHALKSVKKETIDQNVVNVYQNADYVLTTITPLVNSPQRNTYKLNQAELEAFLEGYEDYAEFIIELRMIEKNSK